MSNSESYSNKDDVSSATWPIPLCATGDYPYAYLSVPQSTHPDLVSAPGSSTATSYVPDFNAAYDAAFSLIPTTEMGTLANMVSQSDFTNLVSNQCVASSTSTYPVVAQNVLDTWPMQDPCMFLSRVCYDPSYPPICIQSVQREFRGLPTAAGW